MAIINKHRNIVGGEGGLLQHNNIFTRSPLGGLQVATAFGGYTSHNVAELAAKPYSVRIAIPNLTTGTPAIAGSFGFDVSMGAVNSAQDKGGSVSTWYPLTFGGAASDTHLARVSASRPTWVWSDWIPCSPPDRTDSGLGAIIHVNLVQGAALADATWWLGMWMGGASQDAIAQQKWHCYRSTDATDYATVNQATFAGALQAGGNVACMIQYAALSPGHTMLVVGDSISAGTQASGLAYLASGYGWSNKARDILSTAKIPFEVCNLGWSGQTIAMAALRYADIAANIKNCLLFHALYSPNGKSEPMTAANINADKVAFASVMTIASDNNCTMVYQTGLPSNAAEADGGFGGIATASSSFGSGDPNRVAYNDEMLASGAIVHDADRVLRGVVIAAGAAAGQIEYAQAYTTDGLHPNNAGYDVWGASLARFLRSYI